MIRLMATGLALIFLTTATTAIAFEGVNYEEQLDWSKDRIALRIVVPSTDRPQGEIQLVQRGDLLVVQTLLNSRILKRVVAEIDDREGRSWPETRPGHLDSNRYRDELFRAYEQAWQAFQQREDHHRTRQTLLIEFILGPEQSLIALSLPQFSGAPGTLAVTGKHPISVWSASKGYVWENMLEIIKDSFNLDDNTAEELMIEIQAEPNKSGDR